MTHRNFKFFLLVLVSFYINTLFAHELKLEKNFSKKVFTQEELDYIENSGTLKVAMMSNFKPFSYIENRKHQGFTVDLLHLISDITHLKFDIHTGLWRHNLKKFKSKEFDIIAGISHTKKREEFSLFSDAYYEIPTYIFGLKDSPKISSIYDLKDKRVAISHELYYKEDLIKNGIQVLELENSKQKAKALILGEVDYFLAAYTSGKKAIASQSLTSITPIDEFKGVKKEDLRFGIKIDDPLLQSVINKAIHFISKNDYNKLINKWILELKEVNNTRIPLNKQEEKYLVQKEHINLCIDPNWLPFEKIDDKGNHIGLSSDYFKVFKEKLNVPIKLIYTNSWLQSLEALKNRNCDIISLAIRTENRDSFMNLTKPYITTPLVLATKFNKPFIANFDQIKNKKVAMVEGYAFYEILKNKYPNLNIVTVKSVKEGLEKTVEGEVFGMIDALPSIVYKLQNHYLGELKIGAKFDEKFNLGVGVRKDSLHLLNIFNKLIDSIPENKKQEILNKHISVKYEDNVNYDILLKTSIFVLIIFLFLIYRQYIQNKNNEQLKESFNKIQTILDTTMEAIIISENRKVIDVNKEFLKLFNYKNKKEVLYKDISEIVEENSKIIFFANIKDEFNKPYELKFLKSDNTIFSGLIRGKNIKTKNANFRVSTIMDLTSIKEKEALLIQQSKVATAGEMLENISHQWRQPLSQISTIATGIKIQKEYDLLNDTNLIKDMDNINNSVQYLSQTIEDFNSFLKPSKDKIYKFKIKDTIEKLKKLTKDAYEYHKIKIITDTRDCTLVQNENLLLQALLNIANNAKDALLEKNGRKGESFIFITSSSDNQEITLSIKDNGGGIKPEIINKIFEPYFTTKHESQGTGIGLYMTYQIITKQTEGTISVRNTNFIYKDIEYTGAEFIIKIPY